MLYLSTVEEHSLIIVSKYLPGESLTLSRVSVDGVHHALALLGAPDGARPHLMLSASFYALSIILSSINNRTYIGSYIFSIHT